MTGRLWTAIGVCLVTTGLAGCFFPPVVQEEAVGDGTPAPVSTMPVQTDWTQEWERGKADYEDQNQKIEWYTPDGELLLLIDDNEQIFYHVKSMHLDKWNYFTIIPQDAQEMLVLVSYLEKEGKGMVEVARDGIYCYEAEYYIRTMVPGTLTYTLEAGLPHAAGKYLVTRSGVDSPSGERYGDQVRTKTLDNLIADEIFRAVNKDLDGAVDGYVQGQVNAVWNPVDSADSFGLNDFAAEAAARSIAEMTYEQMLSESTENRTELWDAQDSVLWAMDDNRQIYDFLQGMEISRWSPVGQIPENAQRVCSVVRYQMGRRQYAGQMMEQNRFVIYFDGEQYYADLQAADPTGEHTEFLEAFPLRYTIPGTVGEALAG